MNKKEIEKLPKKVLVEMVDLFVSCPDGGEIGCPPKKCSYEDDHVECFECWLQYLKQKTEKETKPRITNKFLPRC